MLMGGSGSMQGLLSPSIILGRLTAPMISRASAVCTGQDVNAPALDSVSVFPHSLVHT